MEEKVLVFVNNQIVIELLCSLRHLKPFDKTGQSMVIGGSR